MELQRVEAEKDEDKNPALKDICLSIEGTMMLRIVGGVGSSNSSSSSNSNTKKKRKQNRGFRLIGSKHLLCVSYIRARI